MTEPLFPARVVAAHYEAVDVISFLLAPIDRPTGGKIDPGAHIDVHLPVGMMRSYSLSNKALDEDVYRITVARDANSKGGSLFMHESLRVGQVVDISAPRNNFVLNEQAPMSTFIAGGIGVTPFVPMIAGLNALGRKWQLHYCVRTRDRAALLGELEQLKNAGSGELFLNFDGEPDGKMLDLPTVLASLPGDTHVYCCGPTGMLDAFRAGASAANFPSEQVHFEYFSSNVESATEGGFRVILQKSGLEVTVAAGETILQAVTKSGIYVPYSCEEGICGACETRVISGVPDHRDMILSDYERAEGKIMMICCSGSKSAELVLDL
jgi:vanillate O-demethylase ferredoxin subunit